MKKFIIILAAALGFAAIASAQPRAIGARFGYGLEASYQHGIGSDFIEADLGFNVNGFNLTGTYNFNIANPDWTPRGEWGFYAGPGATLGVWNIDKANALFFGVVGQVGLEFTFWFPLQLSADIRPAIGFTKDGFYASGIASTFFPTISARYRF